MSRMKTFDRVFATAAFIATGVVLGLAIFCYTNGAPIQGTITVLSALTIAAHGTIAVYRLRSGAWD